MADLALTDAERTFLKALDELGVRYLIVGLSAAVLQGADTVTADIDLWFEHRVPSHFGMMPPMLGGEELGDRLDVVLTVSGLRDFASEARDAKRIDVDGVDLPVLPLDRVIHSKRAAGRPKDLAVLPALEAALAASTHSDDE